MPSWSQLSEFVARLEKSAHRSLFNAIVCVDPSIVDCPNELSILQYRPPTATEMPLVNW